MLLRRVALGGVVVMTAALTLPTVLRAQAEPDVAVAALQHLLARTPPPSETAERSSIVVQAVSRRAEVPDAAARSVVARRLGATVASGRSLISCRASEAYPVEAEDCSLPGGTILLTFTVESLAADSAIVTAGLSQNGRSGLVETVGQTVLLRRTPEGWVVDRILREFAS